MHTDFTVIGSGMSGLTAALVLAKHGRSVTLVERHPHPAPVLRGFTRQGIYFDTGFHYAGSLGDGEILDRYLRYLGLAPHLRKIPLNPEGFDIMRYTQSGFEFSFPYGVERIRQALLQAFPSELQGIDAFLNKVQQSFASSPFLNPGARYTAEHAFPEMDSESLGEVLARLLPNELCRSLLGVHCLLHGTAPEEVPFLLHARIVGSYFETVCALEGGGRSLVNAFLQELKRLGVTVLCGREATGFEHSDDILTGVRLADGEVINCSGCVATLHPAKLAAMLPQSVFRQTYLRRLQALEETPSAYMIFGKLDNPPPTLLDRNYFVLPRTDIDSYFRPDTPFDELPIYISASHGSESGTSKTGVILLAAAPPNQVARWTDSRLGARPPEYVEFKRDILARLQERAERHCPELRGMALLEGATPLTFRDYANSQLGGLYGASHKITQSSPMPRTKLKGLYLAGQSIIAPGVLGTLISAMVTCANILGAENILQGLHECP
ncbi:NAD(P)/FAD-dependent oxidoreductase [Desulfocurvibacter africanus]|uniref:phytoene desaturase family protein n=1 Tax=Desulfocurvibacter africanus TaxID=873 RepID=UPI002FDB54BE